MGVPKAIPMYWTSAKAGTQCTVLSAIRRTISAVLHTARQSFCHPELRKAFEQLLRGTRRFEVKVEGAATPDMAGVDAREALQLVRKAAVLVAGLHELTPHLAVKLKTENHFGDVGNDTVCGEFVERT